MKSNAALTLSLAVLAALFASACTTPVAIDPKTGQEQTARFTAGYFYGPIDAEAGTIFRTAIRQLDNMGYFRTGELHKDASITIYARKVGDEKVTVRIAQLAPGQCEMRIRVGSLGNLPESQKIYATIRDAL
ncbi:DUF3568 family protein [Coraliomargarita parva]|uniref:DUF3568 family protein n=1 Tax=Coraliomargarita parva TaxID=3014050 RepID=UPI0022B4A9DE|nr:DUF3568 family protein [Coraliomargarita parva]